MKLTLCGSARFEQQFHEWNEKLTLAGHVVYALAAYPSLHGGDKNWYNEEQKMILDQAHFAKIDNSDAIVVLNVDGYVGASTTNEIRWARMKSKTIFWLEPRGARDLRVDHLVTGDFILLRSL